jgi:hypothetical protein
MRLQNQLGSDRRKSVRRRLRRARGERRNASMRSRMLAAKTAAQDAADLSCPKRRSCAAQLAGARATIEDAANLGSNARIEA